MRSWSSAGVLFYPDVVTYPDNTKEDASYAIFAIPNLYKWGKKPLCSVGGGMCVIKSDSSAGVCRLGIFLEWFTRPEQNLRFTLSSGYRQLPRKLLTCLFMSCVGSGASVSDLVRLRASISRLRTRGSSRQLKTILQMYDEYEFFYTPHAQNSENLQSSYENRFWMLLWQAARRWHPHWTIELFFD